MSSVAVGSSMRVVASGRGAPVRIQVLQRPAAAGTDGRPTGDEAYRSGFEAGTAAARAACAEELAALRHALDRTVSSITNGLRVYAQELEAQARGELTDLALQFAESISRCDTHRLETVQSALREALALLPQAERLTLYLSPADAELFAENPASASGAAVDVVPEPGLAPGDVRFECGDSVLDARVRVRLEAVRRAMCERLNSGNAV